MASTDGRKWKTPTGVDGGALEKAELLLQQTPTDVAELTHFLARGFPQQCVQTWAYLAQANEHGKFTAASSTLTRLLRAVGEHDELTDYGVQIIKDILTAYNKTLYRALSSMRASVANPVLRLLNEIVLFRNGALLDDFVALFDFSLPVLPKLLVPTKAEAANPAQTKEKEHLSMRYYLIRLLINIVKHSAPLLRKDFLTNNAKLLSNWFKYAATIDSEALVLLTLSTWDDKVLHEPSFKKATKLKVLNEWNVTKLLPLYYQSSKDLRTQLNRFILTLTTDQTYGLRFNHDETWFLHSNTGALEVNKRHFRTNNKALFSILSGLKPWDDDMQLQTTVHILRAIPELTPPYAQYLASRGLHDPKLTSYWIGQTLLVSKMIGMDIPEEIEEYSGLEPPAKTTVAELMVPSVLNRTVLAKCLQSDVLLIRQLSAQLLMNSVLKLKKFVQLYDAQGWHEAKVDLVNYIYFQLPDLATVSNAIADSYSKQPENKILLATLLMVMNHYTSLFYDNHNFSQSISKPYMDVINSTQYTSIDLVLLDNFLQLQGDTAQLKWWNKSEKSNSLFTSLLKIASSHSASTVTSKVQDLLSSLLQQTVVFNTSTLKVDPAIVLVYSLQLVLSEHSHPETQTSKIWTLLDETISRCVRTPYKYLDIANSHSRISAFLITLFEQWKFVEKSEYTLVSKWLVVLLRLFIIVGEPQEAIVGFVKDLDLDFEYEAYLFQHPLEESVKTLKDDEDLHDGSCFSTMTCSELESIKDSAIPVSDLDIVGCLLRLESAVESTIPLQKFQRVFTDVLNKIGNYLNTHPQSTRLFAQKKYWGALFLVSESDKSLFVSGVLVEIFSQVEEFDPKELAQEVSMRLKTCSEAEKGVLAESLWCLGDDELKIALDDDHVALKRSALEIMCQRRISIRASDLAELLSLDTLRGVLVEFVEQDLVVYDDLTVLFRSLLTLKNTKRVLHALVRRPSVLNELMGFISSQGDAKLITFVASAITADCSLDKTEELQEMFTIAKTTASELISSEDFTDLSFEELSTIFTNPLSTPTPTEKSIVMNYALEKSNKFAPEIPTLFRHIADFTDPRTKTWLNKSVLYLTKIFAEYPSPPSHFFAFLANFKSLVLEIDVPKTMNRANVNALLEVILTKWVRHETALEFAAIIVVTCSRAFLEFGKLLQILVNSDENVLLKSGGASSRAKFFTALLIQRLYDLDPSKNSTVPFQEKVLALYSGSTRAEDLLLLKVLEKLESKLNSSWIDQVYSWDFLETLTENEEELIGETRLIEKKREGFVVVLNKKYVINGLNNYGVTRHSLDLVAGSSSNWEKVEKFYQSVSLVTSPETSQTVYDPLFLSLLIINNDELVSVSSATEGTDMIVKSNMKKLVESELLSSIILNLATEDTVLHEVTKKVISSLLSSLKVENLAFKEKTIFEIFFTKILYTFAREDSDADKLTPLTFVLVSRMVSVLNNPGHMMYEKTFRWVLKNPYIRTNEIPLFQDITTMSTTSEESDLYYKQVSWLIEGMCAGVKTKGDIQLLRNKNVFEWIMNLLNSPYLDTRLRFQVYAFISAVQGVEDGDVLISRYAGLTNLEQRLSTVEAGNSLSSKQEILNLKELAVKYAVIGQSKKRLVDWTGGDVDRFTKRVMASKSLA